MPRRHSPTLTLGTALLRHYLVHANPGTGDQILADAFGHGEAGALELLRLALEMRANVRTVHPLAHFQAEWGKRGRRARWYTDSRGRFLSLFRTLRKLAQPNNPATDSRLQLSRQATRLLTGSGATRECRTTLRDRAAEQADLLMGEIEGARMVLWMDNHYLERFGTNPGADVLSQNVTAMAVLLVDRDTGPVGTPGRTTGPGSRATSRRPPSCRRSPIWWTTWPQHCRRSPAR
jgi:hypothetical protein